MIYLGQDLQRKAVPLLHYALRPGGYVFLGPAETVVAHPQLFRPLDKKQRIFQRIESALRPAVEFPLKEVIRPKQPDEKRHKAEEPDFANRVDRLILQQYAPACVVVNANGDAEYFSGHTSRYLEQPAGRPDNSVINMAREGLRIPLRMALHKAVTAKKRAGQKRVPVKTNGGLSHVDVSVEPLKEFAETNLFLIVFKEPAPETSPRKTTASAPVKGAQVIIQHLESEVRSARKQAQAAFEELETTNEELRSANEEFQSTNEELETSKEEIQSFNEELETINSELKRRVSELDHAYSDLQNLLNSTEIATIFLDSEVRIRSFTPSAGGLFRLIAGDVGRPFTDLASQFPGVHFVQDIKEVLRTLSQRERMLAGSDGRFFQKPNLALPHRPECD